MEANNPKNTGKDSLLSRWINRNKENEAVKPGIPRKPEGVQIPLSLGQQRLWFLQQLYPGNPFYHYADAYRIHGFLDEKKLIEAFRAVARNHEILRTAFPAVNGQPIQLVHGEAQLETSVHDLCHLPKDQTEAEAEQLAFHESRRPFDLENGPLTRLTLFQLDENEYLAVLTLHHIITDKWSMRLLLEEWAATYRAMCEGQPLPTAKSSTQYADFAHWHRQQPVDFSQLEYWKKKLEGELAQLQLPASRPRPVRPSFRGGFCEMTMPAGLSENLSELARENNTTLFVLLLTAFKVLLHRYSGQADIIVGTPFTNRDQSELEKLIGFFNDTLVLRSEVQGEMMFTELLAQVRQTTLEAFANKNVPFETLVNTLKPERGMSINPLFQVMFLFNNVQLETDFGPDLQLEHAPFDTGVSKFDPTLYVSEDQGRLTTIFEYSEDLFDKKTIEQMQEHWQVLLEGIAGNPKGKIAKLPLLTEIEKQQLLVDWNDTATELPEIECIHHFFEKQVIENPGQTAIVFQDKKLSYKELNDQANAIAGQLLAAGLRPNTPVGLCTERSPEMAAGILGILKAGGAYLPLDPEYPPERLAFMLKDSTAPIVLAQPNLEGLVAQAGVKTILLGGSAISPRQHFEQPAVKASDLAYLLYTSGSTGQPKGVAVTHANLVNSTAARFSFYEGQPGRFLLMSSFAFDSSVAGIFWPLCSGGTLVLPEKRIEQDMERLAEVISKNKVTHTLLLPSLYQLLLQHATLEKLASLSTVIVAGEVCPASLCQLHFEKIPAAGLYNEYGPTETTVWCIAHRISPEDVSVPVPIGRPIANTQAFIFDKNRQPVPPGVTGELYIGGAGVSNGYWKRPELTTERFSPLPTSPSLGGGRGEALPHRRPRPLPPRWRHRFPGSCRPAGENSRIPDRVGRNQRDFAKTSPGEGSRRDTAE